MRIEKFEDIIAWQKSKVFSLNIYTTFKTSTDFGFRDQILRASVSIMNNIAEGFERKGDKEFKHFRISKFASWTKTNLLVRRSSVNAILSTRVGVRSEKEVRRAL